MSNQKIIGVDVGNSSIKSAEFLESSISEMTRWSRLEDVVAKYPDAHFIVSSVGKSKESVEDMIKSKLLLDAKTPLPISIDYHSPKTLGTDRIAAAVGAWQLFQSRDILIIDGGTCMTYDIVTAAGVYLGGMISPGLEMRLKAMHHFTNALPFVDFKEHDDLRLIGKTTDESLLSGAKYGLKFEIQGVLETFNKKYDHLQVVVTGGLGLDFESTLKAPIFASSKIVLSGLHAIWKFNEVN